LPILEDLLINRLQLMRLYRERLASNRKHEERKRGTPEWAAAELARQRSELLDKIKTNRLSIKLELDRVFGALEHGNTTEEVTYH
ncbi:MAG: hypothetical protein KDD42_09610, partial [Bdellovibrionales bacterium]|nr:hypothetical protein [Bdellovibrionales bacterium]